MNALVLVVLAGLSLFLAVGFIAHMIWELVSLERPPRRH